jgi:Uma2 family endonuclease
VVILSEARKLEKRAYTYGDLKKFPTDERWELINGIPCLQARPSFKHQDIMLEIATQIRAYLRGKPCQVVTETAVWLEEMSDSTGDYVVPDIVVVCNENKIIENAGIVGPPDLIVEIISPSNEYVDRHDKLRRYRLAGVKEYWIVDPKGFIAVHTLSNNFYQIESFSEGSIKVSIFDDLEINLDLIFSEKKG